MIRYLGLRAKKIAPRAARAVRKGCFVMKIPLKPRSLCQNRRISYLSRENHKNLTSKKIAQITDVPTSVGAACSCPGVQAFIARYILDPQIFRHLSRFIFDKCLPKNLAYIEKIIAINIHRGQDFIPLFVHASAPRDFREHKLELSKNWNRYMFISSIY